MKFRFLQILLLQIIIASPIIVNGVSDYFDYQDNITFCCENEEDKNEKEEIEETEIEFFHETIFPKTILVSQHIIHSNIKFGILYRSQKVPLPPPEFC